MSAQRQKLMTGMAFVLGIVTAFQPAGLQIYFLVSGVLGAGTGWLLRQNGFRRAINIRAIPTKESEEMYTKVVKGELKLSELKSKGGKIQYQAPRAPANRRTATTLSGINIKPGTDLPAHLKPAKAEINSERPDRDADFEDGAQGTMKEKLDYYRRNYRIAYIYRRVQGSLRKMTGEVPEKTTKAQQMRKKRAEEYEIERRRRFENRK
jgi:YidC/Oxa1 family membrane protein insertase